MSHFRDLPARGVPALRFALRNPRELVRLCRAMDGGDGWTVADVLHQHGDAFLEGTVGVRLMVAGGAREVTFERDGNVWRTELSDAIGHMLWCTGGYEVTEIQAVIGWLRAHGRDSGLVVDVGANIGTTSIPFAQAGYRVLAVEPVPRNFDMLRENAASNGFERQVQLVNVAVSTTAGEVQMWTGSGSGLAEVAIEGADPTSTRWGDRGELVSVPALPLDEILAAHAGELDDVVLIWCDVQGSEMEVIRSCPDAWTAGVPLYAEVEPLGLELHGGVSTFVDLVSRTFTSFVTSDDLKQRRPARRIADFELWVQTIEPSLHSDVLLLA